MEDLEAVVDSLGLEKFALLGLSHGGALSIAYTARHPERVSHLILYGASALGRATKNNGAYTDPALPRGPCSTVR